MPSATASTGSLDTEVFLPIGVVVGFVTSFYIVYVTQGRDQSADRPARTGRPPAPTQETTRPHDARQHRDRRSRMSGLHADLVLATVSTPPDGYVPPSIDEFFYDPLFGSRRLRASTASS